MTATLGRAERRRWGWVVAADYRSGYRDYWYPDETPDPGGRMHVVLDTRPGCDCSACTVEYRPISARASSANTARWLSLEWHGFRPLRRSGTGTWVHHDHRRVMFTTAAALKHCGQR